MYPREANWQAYLIFDTPAHANIDPILRERLAAYVRQTNGGKPITLAAGRRTTAEQQALYDRWKAGTGNLAAAPGTSWHEFGFAVDVNDPARYSALTSDYHSAPGGQALRNFGLVLPLWIGNPAGQEPWHIQPIETLGYAGAKSAFTIQEDIMLKQGDNNPQVLAWQRALVATGYPLRITLAAPPAEPNSNFGPATLATTNRFKAAVGLPQDGVVDEKTWAAMADKLRDVVAGQLATISTLTASQAGLSSELQTAKAHITAAKAALG